MKVLHTISGLNKGSGGPDHFKYNMGKGVRGVGIDAKNLTMGPAKRNYSINNKKEFFL